MLSPALAAPAWEQQLAGDGYVVIPDVLPQEDLLSITRMLHPLEGTRAGTRTLLGESWCAELAKRLRTDTRLRRLLPRDAHMAQCTLFHKSAQRNWLVPLHQDLSIPVAARVDNPLCSAWHAKEGVLHVHPPAAVLAELLAVRLHLDGCDESNGALRVVPGSHRMGRLGPVAACQLREERGERVLPVERGGVLLMRPLLLHSSSRAVRNAPRRVLHFLVGPAQLPQGLRWPAASPATSIGEVVSGESGGG